MRTSPPAPRIVLAIALATALVGCGPPAGFVRLEPKPVLQKNYEVGRTLSAAVGEPMIRVQQAYTQPAFTALYEFRPQGTLIPIRQGMRFVAVGSSADGDTLYLMNPEYTSTHWIAVTHDGTPVGWKRLGAGSSDRAFDRIERRLFEPQVEIGNYPGAFTAEIIYSGATGGVVRGVYREYVDNLARPAFSQDLQYDVSADPEIAFRSLRIRVVNATNSRIEYQVLSDGGLPWLPRPGVPAVETGRGAR